MGTVPLSAAIPPCQVADGKWGRFRITRQNPPGRVGSECCCVVGAPNATGTVGVWGLGDEVAGGAVELVPLGTGELDVGTLRGRGDPLRGGGAEDDLHLGRVPGDPGGCDRFCRHVVGGREPVDDRVQLGKVRVAEEDTVEEAGPGTATMPGW